MEIISNSGHVPDRNELEMERNFLAHERTLRSWLRTSISLISFGFTIYKFFQEATETQADKERMLSPRIVGMIMILFGLLALLLAQMQRQMAVKKIREAYPDMQKSISSLISVLVLVFGLTLFLGALFRQ
jgi:putative membrane protein